MVPGLKFSQLTRDNSSSSSRSSGEHHSWVSIARLVVGRKEGELRLCLDQRVRLAWQPALHCMLLAAGEDVASLWTAMLPASAAKTAGGGSGQQSVVTHINVTEKVSLLISTGNFFSDFFLYFTFSL